MKKRALGLLSFAALALLAHAQEIPVTPATPATETIATFHLLDGFKLQLLAAEPLVTDPVSIAYDEFGRAYVAEMNDYPYTDKSKHQPMQENPTDEAIGKIRLLTDEDGDGAFDKSTIFAAGLSWPTGVVPWKGGIFVTAAPDFWYFKDTDNDGVADIKEKILSGFRKYNVQSEANTPVWGPDNRIYIATGRNKGELQVGSDQATQPIPGGRDVRIDPRNLTQFEFVSGGIQFGNAFDDWGNRFLCSASGSAHHAVMPAAAFDRNPWLPSRTAVRSCLTANDPIRLFPITPIEGWRLQRYEDRKYGVRPGYTESRGVHPGDPSRPTSSCGHAIYRGDAYPEIFRGTFFVAESCYGLVYRLDSKRNGPTFELAKPAGDRKNDFLASEDVWFRPIALINAPDGCLHLLDLYRESIEHPWSLPEAFHARMDMLRGRDRGRIYRIVPPGYQHRPLVPLGELKNSELVAYLEHRNAWHRETAQRLLFEAQDKSVVPALETTATSSESELGRLHALWTLHGLDALRPELLIQSFNDPSPGVRTTAAKIAALMVTEDSKLLAGITALAEDPDASVRFHAALAIGSAIPANNEAASKALSHIARKDAADPWTRLAVLSSALPHAASMLDKILSDDGFLASPHTSAILEPLAHIIGARNQPPEISRLIAHLVARSNNPDNITLTIANGLDEGLRDAKTSLGKTASLTPDGSAFLKNLIDTSRFLASDSKASPTRRTAAINLLRAATFEEVVGDLASLLHPGVPEAVQSSAAAALGALGSRRRETGNLLLANWDGYSGAVRNQVLQLLLAREERLEALLAALESGKVQPYQLGPTRRETLATHKNPTIAKRAKRLFAGAGSRDEVLATYQAALTLKGEPAKGEAIYQATCMACHKFREEGLIDLAPNLAVIAEWEPERILTNIIDPNREVAPEYMEYLVETRSGDTLTGRVLSESASGITLNLADNSLRNIQRSDIATFKNSGRSLMPDGLEAVISPQQMADLIAFLTR